MTSINVKDAINPDHYKVGGIEAIDYVKAKLSPEEYRGYLRGNALKYLSRAGHKDEAAQEIMYMPSRRNIDTLHKKLQNLSHPMPVSEKMRILKSFLNFSS